MRWGDIYNRMLLAALLPATLLAVVLAGVFMTVRYLDFQALHDQQARALTRQVASAIEYGLYSGNKAQLEAIAKGFLREPDVLSVAIFNDRGERLVLVGQAPSRAPPILTMQESAYFDRSTDTDLVQQAIVVNPVELDDLYQPALASDVRVPQVLGHVLIEFSHAGMHRQARAMLLLSLLVTLGGLLFAYLLGLRLGRGVIRPILRVSDMIERLGSGELSVRGVLLPGDPMYRVQQGLNQMAERLAAGRDELERQVATATLALREKKEEAETATRAKSRFLAAASHDLRQPTHALGMFVARLAQLPHDAQTRQLIGNLEAALRAMQDLLDGLLDISRLDAQAVPVQLQVFALTDIFEQLRLGLSLTAAEKGLRLRLRPSPVWVLSDPALLHRILLNLLDNALRYTRHGGVLLAARCSADGSRVRVEVWDSGIGIAPEHQQAIFTEFFQVGNSERDRNKGLGLGLNIVQRSANLLGHRLQLCSRLGRGTRFSIEVPRVPSGALAGLPRAPELQSLDDLVGLVLLVVEDDALAREGLVHLLQSWGAIVRVAEGLSTALEQLKQGLTPDVIVSDYRLRDGENGIDIIYQLRRAAGQLIPACLMSGDTNPALMLLARSAGLSLLHKPVRPAKLRSLVRRLASPQREGEGADLK